MCMHYSRMYQIINTATPIFSITQKQRERKLVATTHSSPSLVLRLSCTENRVWRKVVSKIIERLSVHWRVSNSAVAFTIARRGSQRTTDGHVISQALLILSKMHADDGLEHQRDIRENREIINSSFEGKEIARRWEKRQGLFGIGFLHHSSVGIRRVWGSLWEQRAPEKKKASSVAFFASFPSVSSIWREKRHICFKRPFKYFHRLLICQEISTQPLTTMSQHGNLLYPKAS